MRQSLILVCNILQQANVPDDVIECLKAVNELMDEKLEALSNGEIWAIIQVSLPMKPLTA